MAKKPTLPGAEPAADQALPSQHWNPAGDIAPEPAAPDPDGDDAAELAELLAAVNAAKSNDTTVDAVDRWPS